MVGGGRVVCWRRHDVRLLVPGYVVRPHGHVARVSPCKPMQSHAWPCAQHTPKTHHAHPCPLGAGCLCVLPGGVHGPIVRQEPAARCRGGAERCSWRRDQVLYRAKLVGGWALGYGVAVTVDSTLPD